MPDLIEPVAETPQNIGLTFRRFVVALCCVAYHQALQADLKWGRDSAGRLARSVAINLRERDAQALFDTDDDTDYALSKLPLAVFEREMRWFIETYTLVPDDEFEDAFAVLADPQTQEHPNGNPYAESAVEAAETIKGSLEAFVEKLPKWLRRIIDTAMEIAKLAKLGF